MVKKKEGKGGGGPAAISIGDGRETSDKNQVAETDPGEKGLDL